MHATLGMSKSLPTKNAAERLYQRLGAATDPAEARSLGMVLQLPDPVRPVTASQLAAFILPDPTLTAQILALAGTFHYNPQGLPFETVEEAISAGGAGRMRNLTISLMISASQQRNYSGLEITETAGLALASGLLTRQLVTRHEVCEPAFGLTCGLLRTYGRLMLAEFLTLDYPEAMALATRLNQDDQYLEVFGLAPAEMAHHALQAGLVPEALSHTLREAPNYLLTSAVFAHEEEVLDLTDLAFRLCQTLNGEDAEAPRGGSLVEGLLEEYGLSHRLRGYEVDAMLVRLRRELTAHPLGQTDEGEGRGFLPRGRPAFERGAPSYLDRSSNPTAPPESRAP